MKKIKMKQGLKKSLKISKLETFMKKVIFTFFFTFFIASLCYASVGEIEKVDGTVYYKEKSGIPYKKQRLD